MRTSAQWIWFAGLVWIGGCNVFVGIVDGTGRDASFCTTLADCVVGEPACRTAVACTERRCVFDDQPEDTPLAEQVSGDCARLVCDGEGRSKLVPDSDDVQDDGDVCTLDECVATTPRHTLQAVLPCYTGPDGTRHTGICADGLQQCDAEGKPIGDCEGQVLPGLESCIAPLDEDCDGLVNEAGAGCACVPGEPASCYTGPAQTFGVGECHEGTHKCSSDGLGYQPCFGEQKPVAEVCDAQNLDEDCDGVANDGCSCGDGILDAAEGEQCDDGNQDSSDGCTVLCTLSTCGDGIVQPDWEDCDDGNLKDGDACPASCQIVIPIHTLVTQSHHTCAVFVDGRVKCWGFNLQGGLGVGDTMPRGANALEMGPNLPVVDLGTGETAVGIGAGDRHTCALLQGGRVKCWGRASALGISAPGDMGDSPGEMGDALPTVDLGTGKKATSLSAGNDHSCALLDDAAVKCWGQNDFGQLGQGDTLPRTNVEELGDSLAPVNLGMGKKVVALAAGLAHTCALLDDSNVKCWGYNATGQLGLGDMQNRGDEVGELGDNVPAINFGAGNKALSVAAGRSHTCALLQDGTVKCWGNNSMGQLGLGDTQNRGDGPGETGGALPAVELGTGKKAVAIAAGGSITCARLDDGSTKCWGRNSEGQLGLGDGENRGDAPGEMGDNLPVLDFGAGKKAVVITAGIYHTCAVLDNERVKCWGANGNGQIGLGGSFGWHWPPNDLLPRVWLW